MSTTIHGKLLHQPSELGVQNHELTKYKEWLSTNYNLHFNSHNELWEWSTNDIENFWKTIWEYGGVISSKPYEEILSKDPMPFSKWFKGAQLNYAEQIFKNNHLSGPALIFKSEHKATTTILWDELSTNVAAIAQGLRNLGVKKGDRVVAFMPNIPETIMAFLACSSIGAIWSATSPDFGASSVVDRFKQIEPTVLITIDGYQYNGTQYDKKDVINRLLNEIPSIKHTILVNYTNSFEKEDIANVQLWDDVIKENRGAELKFEQVEFAHPLWILYSSGTTGMPKPIVHSHGGIILEQLKTIKIEGSITEEDRLFWFTTTGWMMWNLLVGGLINGSTIVLYDGSPSYPNLSTLWAYAEEVGTTIFGTSAAFIDACMKFNFKPNEYFKLEKLRQILSTASPLTANAFEWVYKHIKDDILLVSTSGGTDVCTAFVGGNALLPVRAGVIPMRALGVKVESFNDAGKAVYNEVGELVITKPMPSMPIFFWGDDDFRRYKESYFETFDNIWRHGDWIQINEDGSCVIYGRSDSTINRLGVRMGTSDIYKIVESFPEILDSLVIDLEYKDRDSFMPLFIVLKEGEILDNELRQKIKNSIKTGLSPRFVPDEIISVTEIPKTLNGKKLEVPIRKILLGLEVEKSINRDAMANPISLDFFIDYRKTIC